MQGCRAAAGYDAGKSSTTASNDDVVTLLDMNTRPLDSNQMTTHERLASVHTQGSRANRFSSWKPRHCTQHATRWFARGIALTRRSARMCCALSFAHPATLPGTELSPSVCCCSQSAALAEAEPSPCCRFDTSLPAPDSRSARSLPTAPNRSPCSRHGHGETHVQQQMTTGKSHTGIPGTVYFRSTLCCHCRRQWCWPHSVWT